MANGHMKRCWTLPIIREMRINTTIRYDLTPVRSTIFKQNKLTKVGKDVEKREPSYAVGGIANWCSHLEEQYRGSSKS